MIDDMLRGNTPTVLIGDDECTACDAIAVAVDVLDFGHGCEQGIADCYAFVYEAAGHGCEQGIAGYYEAGHVVASGVILDDLRFRSIRHFDSFSRRSLFLRR